MFFRTKPLTPPTMDNERVQVNLPQLISLNQSAPTLRLWRSHKPRSQQSGTYISSFKGRGMEFDEARPYQAGDDIRAIDWRVTARTGKVHTKLFREERERPVFLWVDYRAPMFFATRGVFKSVLAAKLASLLAWTANYAGDRVGGQIFTDNQHHELKPRRGKPAVLHFLKQLTTTQTPAETVNKNAIQTALGRLRQVVHPSSLVFLISDFRYLNALGESHLVHLSRDNQVVLFFIYDPLEWQLPPTGYYRLSDGLQEVNLYTGDKQLSQTYAQRFLQHQAYLQQLAQQHGMQFIACATTDDPIKLLQREMRY
ncbi:DUF58 domain-containing protein [Beggiatoa leptomitoformis]|uniref:DUF58 domain-containing protein n=1 Tax=Beggiatoa leptomitoformis TaxID=288004 RepID=A0A2N9YDC0_9GAMM|nr:DUF58 domain-containing protein [Beggiatoa leptomitoformis]ALG69095.1 DUF58 domain-containing protein [Beggiatoa leptomitoformis]AUI68492.1 DUF58 domain-containing protein [Beggiatoa leptomitoformis]